VSRRGVGRNCGGLGAGLVTEDGGGGEVARSHVVGLTQAVAAASDEPFDD
jgi:hypothetical protein